MKTLFLIRHAKSSWSDTLLDDIERPLKRKGKQDAFNMAQFVKRFIKHPLIIISSPAIRATQTAEIFCESIFPVKEHYVRPEMNLYPGTSTAWLSIIKQLDNQSDNAMLFGHNPGITEVAMMLSAEFSGYMGTCSVICLEFNTDQWTDASNTNSRLVFFKKNNTFR